MRRWYAGLPVGALFAIRAGVCVGCVALVAGYGALVELIAGGHA